MLWKRVGELGHHKPLNFPSVITYKEGYLTSMNISIAKYGIEFLSLCTLGIWSQCKETT